MARLETSLTIVAAIFAGLTVFLMLSGCATVNPELAQQMAGVATALDNLPAAPVDPEMQAQISGWSSWAAYLLKAASGL